MTRVFTETTDQAARLERLNSSYVCGTHVRDSVRQCSVTLIDLVSGQPYHTGYHPESYSFALEDALNTLSARPKSNAEIRNMGFTKLVKRDDGVYENVTRSGDEARYMRRGETDTLPHLGKKIGD